jgi:hypothetical protein
MKISTYPMSDTARIDKASHLILMAILNLESVKRSLGASGSPLASHTGKVLDQLNAVDLAVCDLYKALEDAAPNAPLEKS